MLFHKELRIMRKECGKLQHRHLNEYLNRNKIIAFVMTLILAVSLVACRKLETVRSYSETEYFDTTFSSGSKNIGSATVRIKKGFDFLHNPSSLYNEDLALTAVTLSAQIYPDAQGKHTQEILQELGYDSTMEISTGDLCPSSCFGYKCLEKGTNLFAVIVRGTAGSVDKLTDLHDGTHSMFANSGSNIASSLLTYMKGITGKSEEELKNEENYFFFSGHSLGAAVANYLSIDNSLMEYVHKDKNRIYTYTFESPHTCVNLLWMDPEGMSNAFNLKVEGDAVTNLPPWMGSTTYGKDIVFKVDDLKDDIFNELFQNSKSKTVNDAVSVKGHGDIFGLHDICLDLLYIVNNASINDLKSHTKETTTSAHEAIAPKNDTNGMITLTSMVNQILDCCTYEELIRHFLVESPEFTHGGRYCVLIPETNIVVWFQNENGTTDPKDLILGVEGPLNQLMENVPPQITLSLFTENLALIDSSKYDYENTYQIEQSGGSGYYISAEQYARINICGISKGLDTMGEIIRASVDVDLDAVDNSGGNTLLDSSFRARVEILREKL